MTYDQRRQEMDALYRHLKQACREAFLGLKAGHPNERFYAFGLVTDEVGQAVYPTANGEEALERARATAPPGGPRRWPLVDWAYHLEGHEYFAAVQEVLSATDPYDERLTDEQVRDHASMVVDACSRVLQELDTEGLFGRGAEREALVLVVLLDDMSCEQLLEWAERLNPPSVCERLAAELQAEVARADPTV